MTLSKNSFYFLVLLFSTIFLFSSCKKDNPEIANEEELITTLTYTLTTTDTTGTKTVVFSFKDLDGDGGNNPVITGGTLAANTIYEGKIELLNEINGENITTEVKEESADHQFFFEATGVQISTFYADIDNSTENNPVGIETMVTTNQPSTGKLKITLRHEPNKNAEGVKDGNIANAGGETDIEVEFDVTVE
ncbi:hypothetical protein ACE193_01130 [Bernardetia sp. OM2101]|uniref:hypothetical protein n=1 Tax=Bernardetia sp. OM2101 TaxID=3344876 RepID=UPI0035CFC97D